MTAAEIEAKAQRGEPATAEEVLWLIRQLRWAEERVQRETERAEEARMAEVYEFCKGAAGAPGEDSVADRVVSDRELERAAEEAAERVVKVHLNAHLKCDHDPKSPLFKVSSSTIGCFAYPAFAAVVGIGIPWVFLQWAKWIWGP